MELRGWVTDFTAFRLSRRLRRHLPQKWGRKDAARATFAFPPSRASTGECAERRREAEGAPLRAGFHHLTSEAPQVRSRRPLLP